MVAPFWGPTLDCPEPLVLAEFYQRICGGEIAISTESYAELRLGTANLGFQRDLNYRAPTWPDPRVPQQCHLDFKAADLDAEELRVIAAGATKTAVQPHPAVFRVFLDPAGHAFCLTTYGTEAGPPESR
ncbi:VOC family protein [Kribbella catacumbae]|uniref:VOC family protein n=1 Tax=Kribbella catacumbae TaxID=460086 RepID=UPI00036220FD|nr:VOC family protein [Kribbella catacumbae]